MKWDMVRLGDVGKVITGNTPPTNNKEFYENNDIPFFKPNDLVEESILHLSSASTYIDNRARSKARILPVETVLVSCIGIIGKVAITTAEASTNQQINAIIPDKKICHSNYLANVIFSKKLQLQQIANAPVVPIINKSVFSDIKIPLPPLDEQEHIASILDQADYIIQKRKESIQLADDYIKSVFLEMFGDPVTNPLGWDKEAIKSTTKVITGNTPPRNDSSNYGDYIEWIKTDNITNELYLTQASEYLSEKGCVKGRLVDKNTILMACIAGSIKSIGRVAIANRKVAFNQQINAIIPIKYDLLFLYQLIIMTQGYIQSTINMSLKGILSKGKLEELEFIVPPIDLQNKFARIVEQVEKTKEEMKSQLNEAETLFKALQQQFFG